MNMKRMCVALLALLAMLSARAETNPTDAFAGRWRDARVPNAELRILPEYREDTEGDGDLAIYPIDFNWSPYDDKQVSWTMTARYNAKKDQLEYADGTRIEAGEIVWSGSRGALKLDKQGRLVWMDAMESEAAKFAFTRDRSSAPTAEDFADAYFRVVADLERGSAGAVLKAAQTIAKVLEFAEQRDLWNADGEVMQANLDAAWASLTPDEQARFDAAFEDGVLDPADQAFENYASTKRTFEDAGVGEEMARLVSSPEVALSWEFLASATLNMGNMEDGAREDAVG